MFSKQLEEAIKAPKKLTGKKLDAEVTAAFNKHGNRIQFNIMDLGKISKAGRDAYETGGLEAMEKAVIDAIAKYRVDRTP